MATYYEAAYKQLLMGVSQQDPRDRLDGQLTEQLNMSSDVVYGLRRRSPATYQGFVPTQWDMDQIVVLNTHLSGELCWVIASITGNIGVLNKYGVLVWSQDTDYLKASSRAAIRFAVINNSIYVCNVEQAPKEQPSASVAGYPNPSYMGFWSVQAASFSTKYMVRVTYLDDGTIMDAEFNTPANDGSTAAVDATTLSNIASQIATLLSTNPGVIAIGRGNTVCIKVDNGRPISVTSNNPRTLVHPSNNSRIKSVDDLPAYLDEPFMDNYIIQVGSGSKDAYYRYVHNRRIWLEDAKWGTGNELVNMPLKVMYENNVWSLVTPTYQRRSAGDATTNPTPKFIENGITGMGVFQGRLILLAGEYVCLSATDLPETWYRTTVDSLDPSDPIQAAGSDALSSTYVYTTLFNKDLIIYGSDVQAIIPGNQPVTPNNIVIGVMSRYKCTLYAPPANSGLSQYVGATRGDGYGAVWEIVPSDYQSSQIIANDVTRHIPSYVRGEVRLITASTTSSIVAVGFNSNTKELLIQEYLVEGSDKKQMAWHKWIFSKDILHAVFEQDTLYILFQDPEAKGSHICSIDLRRGAHGNSTTVPRLDFHRYFRVNAAGNIEMDQRFYNLVKPTIYGFKADGVGDVNVGVELEFVSQSGDNVVLKATGRVPDDVIVVGSRYESAFTLTQPKIIDQAGTSIEMYKATVQEFHVTWAYTGRIDYTFSDKYRTVSQTGYIPALNRADPKNTSWLPVNSVSTRLPVRLDMHSLNARFSTSDVYDMCPTLVEYGYRYNQVRGRRT